MQQTMPSSSGFPEFSSRREAEESAVSWAAVVAGAVVTAALSLALLALGAGFGLLSVSPWSNAGASASTVDTAAIIWLVFIEIVSAGVGGYMAGRLRTKWTAVHSDEVYFRDTAHGFLVWAVAVVITAAFLGSAATALVGGAERHIERAGMENGAYVARLFQPASSSTAQPNTLAVGGGDIGPFLAGALKESGSAQADQSYLAQVVSARTGLSQTEATQRVTSVIEQAKQDADAARKAMARMLLWTFLALLIGAFCASFAATIGGRQRDQIKAA